MKKFIVSICCILGILLVLLNVSGISDSLANILGRKNITTIDVTNDYYKDYNYNYVKIAKSYSPYGKQDLLDIMYTFINSGLKSFTFYCPKEYTSCIKDVDDFTKDDDLLTHINNFVHPFNSIESIKTTVSDTGEINISAKYLYTEEDIKEISTEVDRLIKKLITSDITSDYDKIKVVHDYIINNTKYDLDDNNENKSYIAYGALFNHLATCNGYTDLMAIFLSKMNYENYKVATTNKDTETGHVWNAVKVEDKWLHLDLTWDDPVSSDNKDYLYHKYFLIDTEALLTADSNITSKDHIFSKAIYTELK